MTMGNAERVGAAFGQDSDAGAGDGLAAAVWSKVCVALRSELGEATFGSWLGQACLREDATGVLVLVPPTATARDWIRRNTWRRLGDLWGQHHPGRRPPELKCRAEFDADQSGGLGVSALADVAAAAAQAPSAPIARA